ncbi:ATP-binding protein [Xanthomonas campestris pv. incanae]|uniref:ATP-binding protein n=1 Tax=Xanthomonas campestris TaxID=339 RepID=UPI0029C21E34|nr:ATP-binding protein [Xanthomonas campestris]MDX6083479.1 ATP-binding protein [Xanthomonas campestris pv. incanae]MDX6087703.1 ATP-binding protein [Xanthomonas campestris pv. incanae]MDX6141230.1 ATP-binding protein [Xanthomonas campestris pv. incanae]
MTSPIEMIADLVVGTVEAVAPDDIRVRLVPEAPLSTAFNAGSPASFPRLNGYVLIPNEAGATVGFVTWVGTNHSAPPRKPGQRDLDLIDLPYPARRMSVTPVGTLRSSTDRATGKLIHELSRGVLAFPSVGDQVLMPTADQGAAIAGANDKDRRVKIGTSPMANDTPVMVDPNKMFGRHLAVLGNTGSGKSCSVAGLIRWSLEAAAAAKAKKPDDDFAPNARFIVLDPNGEYSKAFDGLGGGARVFRVPPVREGEKQLRVPAWMWNGHEWSAVANAQPGAQRPLLLQGIRELKSGQAADFPEGVKIARYIVAYHIRLRSLLAQGPVAFSGAPRAKFAFAELLKNITEDLAAFSGRVVGDDVQESLQQVSALAARIEQRRLNNGFYRDFSVAEVTDLTDSIQAALVLLPEAPPSPPIGEDAPNWFDVHLLADHLDRIAQDQGGNVAGFISTLGLRIRSMVADARLGSVIGDDEKLSFSDWLGDYIGADHAQNGSVAVVDLSLVPSEIVHIVVAVLGRLVFEALQRYRRLHPEGRTLPTTIVLEEAHSFIRKGREDDLSSAAALCRETFERIAREGRKFGLGMVLSSQRPSELSATVLAQCNTFLLHRIVNDVDQDLIRRLVPDNVGGLLKDLPSLPSRQAVLLGWATPMPILVEMAELPESQRPHSADPDFWEVWTGVQERKIDWKTIADDWAGDVPSQEAEEESED